MCTVCVCLFVCVSSMFPLCVERVKWQAVTTIESQNQSKTQSITADSSPSSAVVYSTTTISNRNKLPRPKHYLLNWRCAQSLKICLSSMVLTGSSKVSLISNTLEWTQWRSEVAWRYDIFGAIYYNLCEFRTLWVVGWFSQIEQIRYRFNSRTILVVLMLLCLAGTPSIESSSPLRHKL